MPLISKGNSIISEEEETSDIEIEGKDMHLLWEEISIIDSIGIVGEIGALIWIQEEDKDLSLIIGIIIGETLWKVRLEENSIIPRMLSILQVESKVEVKSRLWIKLIVLWFIDLNNSRYVLI